ncbi:Pet127-domain-containing protein [Aureobasidium subglaciale]|nr:Pet127-domain-containing protein [Aureobasidium subglaciale]
MPSWSIKGVRPLRPLLTNNSFICSPCRLRLFSTITSRPLRHSTRLLDQKDKDDLKTAKDEYLDPESMWPFGRGDLIKSDLSDQTAQAKDEGPKREEAKDEGTKHEEANEGADDEAIKDEDYRDSEPSVQGGLSKRQRSVLVRKTRKGLKSRMHALERYVQRHDKSEEQHKDTLEGLNFPKKDAKGTESSENASKSTGFFDNGLASVVQPKNDVEETAPSQSTIHNDLFKSLLPTSHDSQTTDDRPKSIYDFFKSSNAPTVPSVYDGGALQSLRDAMMSIKSDPIPIPKRKQLRRPRNKRRRFVNAAAPQTAERIAKRERKREADERRAHKLLSAGVKTMDASSVKMQRLEVDQPPVPRVHHGLDRVLFNQGVHQLQDSRSKVYNFDPYLQKIMPVTEFDYDALSAYKTSSQDDFLSTFAKEHGKKYVGSTSSMTSTLAHFHYLLSAWRKINIGMFSRNFPDTLQSFTALNRTPTAIFLRRKGDTYAIDADKEFDGANVLMLLGRSMEKLLTLPVSEFERYRKNKSEGISEAERNKPESFHYSSLGDFLLRSQLDAHDERLPGTGMFDLKTRAVLPVRMQSSNHEPMTGYEITQAQGQYESFEREYYDMMRSTALKYSLQARMGHMDGIFVAYHNVKRIFGFQYISLEELDRALHGQSDRTLGNQEFNLSIGLLNEVFNKATEKFPDQSIRFHFETKDAETLPSMHIYAEPMSEEEIDTIQNSQKAKIAEWDRALRNPNLKSSEGPADELVTEQEDDGLGDSTSDLMHTSTTSTESESEQSSEMSAQEPETDATPEAQMTKKDRFVQEIEAISSTSETAPKSDDSGKPLLGMILTVRSKVNGIHVDRPEFLRKHHDWSIEYSLTELTSAQAWVQYRGAKGRRRKIYEKLNKPDKTNPDNSEATYNEQYITMLRDLSEKGSKMRAKLDQAAENKPTVVLGSSRVEGAASPSMNTDDVSIESVDDYLAWLYAEKPPFVEEV